MALDRFVPSMQNMPENLKDTIAELSEMAEFYTNNGRAKEAEDIQRLLAELKEKMSPAGPTA